MPATTRSRPGTARAGAGRRFAPTTGRGATRTRRRAPTSGRSASRARRAPISRRAQTRDIGLSTALRRRRHSKKRKSGLSKALAGLLSTGAVKRARTSSHKGRSGALAVLAAGTGLAIKNRDKLAGVVKGRREHRNAPLTTTTGPTPVAPIDEGR